MKTCPYHWDGNVCEDCLNYYTQEEKLESKEPKPESVTDPEKKESLSESLIGGMILGAVIIGFVTFVCYLAVPGFLKPDKEVTFRGMRGVIVGRGDCVIEYMLENKIEKTFIELDKINVVLRNDGKPHTTVLLKNSSFPYPYWNSATILVPNMEGFEKWNKYLNDLRSERAAYLKWEKEQNSPKEVLPRN